MSDPASSAQFSNVWVAVCIYCLNQSNKPEHELKCPTSPATAGQKNLSEDRCIWRHSRLLAYLRLLCTSIILFKLLYFPLWTSRPGRKNIWGTFEEKCVQTPLTAASCPVRRSPTKLHSEIRHFNVAPLNKQYPRCLHESFQQRCCVTRLGNGVGIKYKSFWGIFKTFISGWINLFFSMFIFPPASGWRAVVSTTKISTNIYCD